MVDFFTPLNLMWNQWVNGPLVKIEWVKDGKTGLEVEQIVRGYGVRIFGRIMNDKEILGFYVKKKQENWCLYILSSIGLQLRGGLSVGSNGVPRAWSKKKPKAYGIIDKIIDFLT